jgi:hypothetical protein
MNGRNLTLGALAGLAVAGMVAQRRRGSRGMETAPLRYTDAEIDIVRKEARTESAWFHKYVRATPGSMIFPSHEKQLAHHFGARLLGNGIFRAVIASSDPRFVIKFAMRPSDNLDEAAFWDDAGPKTRTLLVPVVAVDPEGCWLVMERVEPLPWVIVQREDDWAPEDHPAIRAVQRRAADVGLYDTHAANISSDLRIFDYAEEASSRGTPNTRKSR